ncbi:MAG: hypothetical protein GY866_39205 [Proteobacteria bacterium]|nr:hypothetical protein [Pseudomonadota bacterium]
MKGVIAMCLGELVKEKFGKDKWEASLEGAGLDKNRPFLATENVDDAAVLDVVGSVCKVLNITLIQAADAFGEYWVNTFAPKLYKAYYRQSKTAKEMLLNMDKVHEVVTASIPDAQPPRFDYEWKNDNTLLMKYNSKRGLIDFLVGLVKGVGIYFKEDIKVTKRGSTTVEIVFPS